MTMTEKRKAIRQIKEAPALDVVQLAPNSFAYVITKGWMKITSGQNMGSKHAAEIEGRNAAQRYGIYLD